MAPGPLCAPLVARSGIELHPNDRVGVTAEGETGLTITVTRVECGEIVAEVPIDFESTTASSDALFEGESQITQQGVAGVAAQSQWRESIGGVVTKNVTTAQHTVTAPVDEVRTKGTKKVTPEALLQAGIDPKSPLETLTDANGASQTKYSAALGSSSSAEEITASINAMTDQNEKLAAAAGAQRTGLTIAYAGQDPKETAHIMVVSRGWSAAEYQCLVSLWNRIGVEPVCAERLVGRL